MITLMTKYAVIVGLTLAFTAATCSVARSRAGAEQIGQATQYLVTQQLAQYCVPSESTDMPRLFCGRDEADHAHGAPDRPAGVSARES